MYLPTFTIYLPLFTYILSKKTPWKSATCRVNYLGFLWVKWFSWEFDFRPCRWATCYRCEGLRNLTRSWKCKAFGRFLGSVTVGFSWKNPIWSFFFWVENGGKIVVVVVVVVGCWLLVVVQHPLMDDLFLHDMQWCKKWMYKLMWISSRWHPNRNSMAEEFRME